MASSFDRIRALAIAALLGAGAVGAFAAPASAYGQCASNHNLGYVHRRLGGAIGQLDHDQRDYGGHRAAAVNDLARARAELVSAERFAVETYHDDPRCFRDFAPSGGPGLGFGTRGQRGSNADIWGVRRWTDDLLGQLSRDDRDYGGHKAAAMRDIQAARGEMVAAERFAFNHGY